MKTFEIRIDPGRNVKLSERGRAELIRRIEGRLSAMLKRHHGLEPEDRLGFDYKLRLEGSFRINRKRVKVTLGDSV